MKNYLQLCFRNFFSVAQKHKYAALVFRFGMALLLLCAGNLRGFSQHQVVWQRCFGGMDEDRANTVVMTDDGGMVLAGMTRSNDGDVSGQHGWMDVWVLKLDASLNIMWQKCFGGTGIDEAYCIRQTLDGGYILACGSRSTDGDVTVPHGEEDLWILRLDAAGSLRWQKSYGGSKEDRAVSITEADDGSYLVAGYILSDNGDVLFNHGAADIWALNLNPQGTVLWQKSLGGTDWDIPGALVQTKDYGFLIAGHSYSEDGDVDCGIEGRKIWLAKVSHTWNLEWQSCLEGKSANAIVITADTGMLVGGETEAGKGVVYKLYPDGAIQWKTETEGPVYDMTELANGHLLVTGQTFESDSCRLGMNFMVTVLGADGNILTTRRYGGDVSDWGRAIFRCMDGSFLVAGASMSDNCDVSGNHNPFLYSDVWLFRLDDNLPVPPPPDPPARIEVSQNPTGNEVRVQSTRSVYIDLIGPTGICLTSGFIGSGGSITIDLRPYSRGLYLIRERDSGRIFKVIRN